MNSNFILDDVAHPAIPYIAQGNQDPNNPVKLFKQNFVRDKLSCITEKTEVVNGVTTVYGYEYDPDKTVIGGFACHDQNTTRPRLFRHCNFMVLFFLLAGCVSDTHRSKNAHFILDSSRRAKAVAAALGGNVEAAQKLYLHYGFGAFDEECWQYWGRYVNWLEPDTPNGKSYVPQQAERMARCET
jgi:hypothetical protein